jgi:uncharacterized protein
MIEVRKGFSMTCAAGASCWMNIQQLFRLERRSSFQKVIELMLAQSGGLFESTSFSRPCEVSLTMVANYLKVLEATFVAYIVRPFSTYHPTKIVTAPKVYGFDTGFVSRGVFTRTLR